MVSENKQQLVQSLIKDIQEFPIIGILNLENLPAQQYQTMRAMLGRTGVKICMARKRLLQRALTESKKDNIDKLTEKIKGMPALLFSTSNPFSLYSTIQKNKSEAPAKAGQTAPKEVIVKAGPTNFAPGPIISELAAVGIKTKVEGGKLAIIEDTTVAKEGDIITAKLAETLKRLDIKPMEIGLDLVAVWENGVVYDAKHLHIDEAEYAQNIAQAAQWAMNLAMETAYTTTETTELLLQKAFTDAKALSLEQNIITDITAGDILAKVEREALSLKEIAGVEVSEKKAEEKAEIKEEKPAEEAKVEETPKEAPIEEIREEKTEEQKPKVETPIEEKAEQAPEDKPKEEPASEEDGGAEEKDKE